MLATGFIPELWQVFFLISAKSTFFTCYPISFLTMPVDFVQQTQNSRIVLRPRFQCLRFLVAYLFWDSISWDVPIWENCMVARQFPPERRHFLCWRVLYRTLSRMDHGIRDLVLKQNCELFFLGCDDGLPLLSSLKERLYSTETTKYITVDILYRINIIIEYRVTLFLLHTNTTIEVQRFCNWPSIGTMTPDACTLSIVRSDITSAV